MSTEPSRGEVSIPGRKHTSAAILTTTYCEFRIPRLSAREMPQRGFDEIVKTTRPLHISEYPKDRPVERFVSIIQVNSSRPQQQQHHVRRHYAERINERDDHQPPGVQKRPENARSRVFGSTVVTGSLGRHSEGS